MTTRRNRMQSPLVVLLIGLALCVATAAPAGARQSERTRGSTTQRVERRSTGGSSASRGTVSPGRSQPAPRVSAPSTRQAPSRSTAPRVSAPSTRQAPSRSTAPRVSAPATRPAPSRSTAPRVDTPTRTRESARVDAPSRGSVPAISDPTRRQTRPSVDTPSRGSSGGRDVTVPTDRSVRDGRIPSGQGREAGGGRVAVGSERPVIGSDRTVRDSRSTVGRDRPVIDGGRQVIGRERSVNPYDNRRVVGGRSVLTRPDWRPTYHAARWDRTVWYPRYWWRPPVRVYTPTYLRVHWPRIHVHIEWPWLIRYERAWAPVYRYRQTYRIEVGWGSRRDWSNIEVETVYSHRVRYATDDRASIAIRIERVEIYDDGRYLGYVDRLPDNLSRIDATVYRDGAVEFDQDIFLMGDPFVGFEIIATRPYDGWVMDDYRVEDGYRAGAVDLGRNRVEPIRRSRFFDPEGYGAMVPVSLLPDRDGWLWDYGVEALSARTDDYDAYYGGRSDRAWNGEPLTQEDTWSFDTRGGAELRFDRRSSIQRVR